MTELELTQVNFRMPKDGLKKVDDLAKKKFSQRSQILREATMKGLELL